MTIYSVANGKGGTGKTQVASDLAAELANRGRRMLVVDLDQQGNCSTRFGVSGDVEVSGVAADVLAEKSTVAEAATPSPAVPGVTVLAGTTDLVDLETRFELVTVLRGALSQPGEWDDVVIDTPPNLGVLTMSGLTAADVIVAPVECATEAYDQLARLSAVIESRIARTIRPGQQVHYVVPTMYDGRRLLDREVVELLTEKYPGKVTHPIRHLVAVREAYTAGLPTVVYAPKSEVATDIRAAIEQIITSTPVEGE